MVREELDVYGFDIHGEVMIFDLWRIHSRSWIEWVLGQFGWGKVGNGFSSLHCSDSVQSSLRITKERKLNAPLWTWSNANVAMDCRSRSELRIRDGHSVSLRQCSENFQEWEQSIARILKLTCSKSANGGRSGEFSRHAGVRYSLQKSIPIAGNVHVRWGTINHILDAEKRWQRMDPQFVDGYMILEVETIYHVSLFWVVGFRV